MGMSTASGYLRQLPVSLGQLASAASLSVVLASDQSTVPISAASLPLPSGASTAAKQPALGTAGSASADVLTVQGIASMTALKVDGSAVTQPISGTVTANAGTNLNTSLLALESGGNLATIAGAIRAEDAAHSSGHTGIMALAVRQDSAAQLAGSDADYSPLITDSSGRLHVTVGNTVTVSGSALTSLNAALKNEDAGSGNLDLGFPSMAIRKAAPADTSSADGDYEFLQMSAGRLWTSATIDAALPAGSNIIGALTANQSVNVAQINGVTTSMGNGASGTGVQRVTIANDSTGIISLTTSTASIGKLAANSGVDIGDVDVTSIVPGTGATNLGKAEDAIHVSGDTGVMALAVRKDTATNMADADGDYTPLLTDGNGRLHVFFGNSTIGVTAAGLTAMANAVKNEDTAAADLDYGIPTLAVRKATPANTSGTDGDYEFLQMSDGRVWTSAVIESAITDNAAFTDGTSKVFMSGFVYDETAGTTALTENDAAAARVNINRAQVGVLEDAVTRGYYAKVTDQRSLQVVVDPNQTVPISIEGPFDLSSDTIEFLTQDLGLRRRNVGATPSTLASTTTSSTILNPIASRSGASVYNSSTATLYIKTGPGASSTSFTVALLPNAYWELPTSTHGVYNGIITGVWSSANGTAYITEYA